MDESRDPVLARLEPFSAVLEFHRRFNLPIGVRPGFPDDRLVSLRLRLIQEEAGELEQAVADRDVVAVADALADLVYVAYGAAVSFGIDLRPVFEEVHRSNMAKVGGGTRADGKILKPPDWTPPAIRDLLEGMYLADEGATGRDEIR